ncbi:uncharacterized protein [Drosophila virilis]|nr:uncharacterized protein Dvir_GJ16977, isoform C [Drosophila virilis]
MILQERKIVNDSFIKCITTAEEISSKRRTRQSRLSNENQRMLRQLLCLKGELSERQKALVKTKLELHCLRQRLRQQAFRTSRMASRLEENKLLTEKLLERNVKLNERTRELLELYRTRALMFVYKLIGMTQELLATKTRSKAFADASAHLKSKNKKLQLRQRMLINKYTTLVAQATAPKDAQDANYGLVHMALHYMACLWECVSSLGQCPKLEGPNRRFQWALSLI